MTQTTTIRERFLASRQSRTQTVTLGTGDAVEVRPLSLAARAALVERCTVDGKVSSEKLVPALVIATVHDPASGEPLFTEGDLEAITQMPAVEVDPLWAAAATLNGFGDEKGPEKN